jgi:hypothetical protein
LLGLAGSTSAQTAPPTARLSPSSGAADLARPWTTVLTLRVGGRAYRGAAPRLVAHRGSLTRSFALDRTRAGVYRATVVADAVGRWTVMVIVARKRTKIGTLVVRPALTNAVDVALLPDGRLLVPDLANYVYAAAPGGAPTVVAGDGQRGSSGDGGRATAAGLGFPVEVAVDPRGGFAVVQEDRVRNVASDGTITTVGRFDLPTALAYDADGNLFVSELPNRLVRVSPAGTVTTYAGTGAAGFDGDNGPAVAAVLNQPHGIAVDAGGNVFFCDVGNHRVRRIDRETGRITTAAAGLGLPVDLTLGPDGSLYVADFGDNRIVRVTNGAPTTVVAAVRPNGVAVDAAGAVYFTERTFPHVLRFDPGGGRVSVALGR